MTRKTEKDDAGYFSIISYTKSVESSAMDLIFEGEIAANQDTTTTNKHRVHSSIIGIGL